jgi:uncharacterized membrane protein YsdA (DUF1294 family)
MFYVAGIALVVMNLVAFITYGIDKYKSKRATGARRVPERVLLIIAALGGSIGALIAMHIWRHKTKHAKFKYGVPAILLIQVAIAIYLFVK